MVLTAEPRLDERLGWVLDTTPDDYSQRCGLPWVPQVWQGSCLDYLQLIERGPQRARRSGWRSEAPIICTLMACHGTAGLGLGGAGAT